MNHDGAAGIFSVTRNPVYCGHIFFILPGISFAFDNIFCFLATAVSYLLFKILIAREENYLQETFGDDFLRYRERVNQIVPIPRKSKPHLD